MFSEKLISTAPSQKASISAPQRLIIKGICGKEIRRIPIWNRDITYDELCLMMSRIFKEQLGSNIKNMVLHYVDEENDHITLADDVDLIHAKEQCGEMLKILVYDQERLSFVKQLHQEDDHYSALLSTGTIRQFRNELLALKYRVDHLIQLCQEHDQIETQDRSTMTVKSPSGKYESL
jgi:hypothetical protein